MPPKLERTAFFLALLACGLAFAVFLHLTVFPFMVFTICVGFFLLCRENEFLGLLSIIFLLPLNIVLGDFIGNSLTLAQDFLVLVLAIEFFSKRVFSEKNIEIEKNKLLVWFGLFFLCYLLSAVFASVFLVFSKAVPLTVFDATKLRILRELITPAEWLVFFFLSFNMIRTRQDAKRTISLMLLTVLLVSTLAIFQHNFQAYDDKNPIFPTLSIESLFALGYGFPARISSLVSSSNPLGWYVMFFLPLAVCFFLIEKSKLKKIFCALVFVFSSLALFYAGSRAAFFGAAVEASIAVGLLSANFFFRERKTVARVLVFSTIAFLLFSVVFFGFFSKDLMVSGKHISLENSVVKDRFFSIWPTTIKIIQQSPFFGVGPGLYIYYFTKLSEKKYDVPIPHAHNLFLQIAAEAGLVALAVFFVILAKIFFELVQKAKDSEKEKRLLAICIAISLAGLLAAGIFDTVFFELGIALLFWALAAIAFRL